jgi:hypothetical protein
LISGLGAVARVPSEWPRVAEARESERRTVPTLFGCPCRGCGAWPSWTANGIATADNAAPSCWRSTKQRTKRYDAPSAAKLPERSRSTSPTRPGLVGSRSARAIRPMIVEEIARGISAGGRLEVDVWVQPEARWIMSTSSGLGVSGPLLVSAVAFRVHLARRGYRPGPGATHRPVGCGSALVHRPRGRTKATWRLSGVPRAQEPRGGVIQLSALGV